ncbi:hypothetical protein CC78DRAFT_618980 [Lojkania enalia]|uniref:Uncharacterized protein n=1 Tax=Lojkania enalia TaxID=147567 RepID=A0A9P4K4L7_9PLEO|nr:hypothetical protein CC78DRAFT_618980 [Didymosphaeria enalia]
MHPKHEKDGVREVHWACLCDVLQGWDEHLAVGCPKDLSSTTDVGDQGHRKGSSPAQRPSSLRSSSPRDRMPTACQLDKIAVSLDLASAYECKGEQNCHPLSSPHAPTVESRRIGSEPCGASSLEPKAEDVEVENHIAQACHLSAWPFTAGCTNAALRPESRAGVIRNG